jgi:hypothetical protein
MENGKSETESENYKRYSVPSGQDILVCRAFPDRFQVRGSGNITIYSGSTPGLLYVSNDSEDAYDLLAQGDVAIQKAEQILFTLKECTQKLEEIIK